jgi:hypothetical protein
LFILGLVLASLVVTAPAIAGTGDVQRFPQEQTKGFFQGRTVSYLDFGPVRLAPGNTVAPIWVVTNGTRAQRNIIDTVPGDDDYTPLWRVVMVTWKPGETPRTLRSAAAVRAAVRAGDVRVKRTTTVVNCPVLGFDQPETLGFFRSQTVAYLDLGPIKLANGNKVEPIWAFTNGAEGQRNIIDTVPGQGDYTPLWSVRMVTWVQTATPRILRSASDIEAAMAAGEVTIEQTDVVVNCPVL